MCDSQLAGGSLLKSGNLLAKDKLLRLKYMAEGLKQLVVERAVLALEVQHGDGLGRYGIILKRIVHGCHYLMLSASRFP